MIIEEIFRALTLELIGRKRRIFINIFKKKRKRRKMEKEEKKF